MPSSTTRGAFPYPVLSDTADVPADMAALANRIAAVCALDDQGSLASRPSPGVVGRYYTDTATKITYRDDGTVWTAVNPTGVTDGPANTGTLRTLGTGALQAAAGNDTRLSDNRTPTDNSVTAAKINTALKPSAGASGSTEALRALGTAAGTAAPGTHASQHRAGGADPYTVPKFEVIGGPLTIASAGSGGSALNFSSEVTDTDSCWAVGNPARFVFPFTGMWALHFYGNWGGYTTDALYIYSQSYGGISDGINIVIRKGGFSTFAETVLVRVTSAGGSATLQALPETNSGTLTGFGMRGCFIGG